MPIVSLSFPDSMMKDMDKLQRSYGFTGRSELVRSAIRLMLADEREHETLAGDVGGLIVVTHDKEEEAPVTRLKHEYDSIIKTHIHSKVNDTICVELFLVEGDAKKVSSMSKAFEAEDAMKSTKFLRV